jgi:hypothetical protein
MDKNSLIKVFEKLDIWYSVDDYMDSDDNYKQVVSIEDPKLRAFNKNVDIVSVDFDFDKNGKFIDCYVINHSKG